MTASQRSFFVLYSRTQLQLLLLRLWPALAGPPHTNRTSHWPDLAVGQLCAPSSPQHPPSNKTTTTKQANINTNKATTSQLTSKHFTQNSQLCSIFVRQASYCDNWLQLFHYSFQRVIRCNLGLTECSAISDPLYKLGGKVNILQNSGIGCPLHKLSKPWCFWDR